MKVTDTHVYFWGSYLSNFYRCPFNVGGVVFVTSEHYFMIQKAVTFGDHVSVRDMLDAYDGKAVKALGRKVKNFDPVVWDAVSYQAMLDACWHKFSSEDNQDIAEKLLSTGDKVLVEASPLDKIWGVGLHEDDPLILDENNWKGENRLGKVLMEVRTRLKGLAS